MLCDTYWKYYCLLLLTLPSLLYIINCILSISNKEYDDDDDDDDDDLCKDGSRENIVQYQWMPRIIPNSTGIYKPHASLNLTNDFSFYTEFSSYFRGIKIYSEGVSRYLSSQTAIATMLSVSQYVRPLTIISNQRISRYGHYWLLSEYHTLANTCVPIQRLLLRNTHKKARKVIQSNLWINQSINQSIKIFISGNSAHRTDRG